MKPIKNRTSKKFDVKPGDIVEFNPNGCTAIMSYVIKIVQPTFIIMDSLDNINHKGIIKFKHWLSLRSVSIIKK